MSASALARQLLYGDGPHGREAAIDVIRGLCIVSMVFAHIALGGIGYKVTHAAVWFDGAMGFVLLSGLVVGMVQRKTIERGRLSDGPIKVIRRARLVYVAHLFICALAFGVANAFPRRDGTYASFEDVGGWWQALVAALLLQINPPRAAILSLYVVLLLLTAGAAILAFKRWWWLFVVALIGLFAVGHLFPEAFTLPRMPGVFGEINWATWQATYFLAFIVGWNWDRVRPRLDSRPWHAFSLSLVAAVIVWARLDRSEMLPPAVSEVNAWIFGSGQMGPGTVIFAFLVMAALFPIIRWAEGKIPPATSVLARIGRRSLDCYVMLSVLVLLVPSFLPYRTYSLGADLGAVATLLLMWVWNRWRDYRSATSKARERSLT
ncbi:OpgC domain-containing protein [Microbacterium oryzae]|uniref:OpgC domain-containing protein n=1 Tax=Microbacterium oryzae TaxID=743009 RepID=UPI0025AF4C35|nr:OpgC domain-containing protein [Microbacterium oryzae]MDN3310445.1 OpgC domain-containing protein [Microbacterium oryzae]